MQFSTLALTLATWLLISGGATAKPLHETECSRNCAAFYKGYEWAQANDIASEFECDGHGSAVFIAGCAAYIEDSLPDQSAPIDPDSDGDEDDRALQHK
jgi:hypothetical protein